jgi:hypothetical protein
MHGRVVVQVRNDIVCVKPGVPGIVVAKPFTGLDGE